ncbi:MAG: diguanylate cyclase [Actinobacteria bacterium]|nr:diguanylate cyclase [Actinomycetota bacterium]
MSLLDTGTRVLSRLSLTVLTQALEDVALMLDEAGEEGAILAVFQHGRWFASEHDRYARLAAVGPVVVAFGDAAPAVPDGVIARTVDGDVATEWTLVVVSARLCAALVSRDRRRSETGPNLAFVGDWTFRRHQALDEARRLLGPFGDLPGDVRRRIEGILDHAASAPSDHPLAAPMPLREHPNEPFLATAAEQLMSHLERTQAVTRQLVTRLRVAVDDTDRDPLTLLHNRRYLEAVLRERDERGDTAPLVVLSVDVQDMGGLNDAHGEGTGDLALVYVAEALGRVLRDTDLAVRWGGDRFVAVLTGGGADLAHRATARLREALDSPHRPEALSGVDIEVRVGAAVANADRNSFAMVEAALEEAGRGAGSG